nr:PREDICTED: rho guanine nucleotide exchange factor 39-like isoform X1 [Bemisia tabaci]
MILTIPDSVCKMDGSLIYNVNPQTPLSKELRSVIDKKNILSTKTRKKVLKALDEHILTDAEQKAAKRKQNAIQELISSESSYLKQLELVRKFFKPPLLESKLVSVPGIRSLFGDIDAIFNVNSELLQQLLLKEKDIGSVFLELAPYFKIYFVYAYNYKRTSDLIEESMKESPKLKDFIGVQERRPEVGTKLSSLLITPVQRLPRYKLLLYEIVSNTPESDEHYLSLKAALHEIEKITEHMNSRIKDHEVAQRLIAIQRSFVDQKLNIVKPGVRLVKEGSLMKVSKNSKKANPRYFILLSDSLIYCKAWSKSKTAEPNSLSCRCLLPLKKCFVEPILSRGLFKLSCQNFSILLFSQNGTEELNEWVDAINQTRNEYKENLLTLRKKSSSRFPLRRKDLNKFLTQNDSKTDRLCRKRKMLGPIPEENNHVPQNACPSVPNPLKLMKLDGNCISARSSNYLNEKNVAKTNGQKANDTDAAANQNENIFSWSQRYYASAKKLVADFGNTVKNYVLFQRDA